MNTINKNQDADKLNLVFYIFAAFLFTLFIPIHYYIEWLRYLHISQTLGAITIIAYVLHCVKNKKKIINFNPLLNSLIWFTIIVICLLPFSDDFNSSFSILIGDFANSIAAFFLISHIVDSLKKLKITIIIFIIGGIFLAYLMIHNHFFGHRFFGRTYARIPYAHDPNDIAMVLVYTMALAGGLLACSKNYIKKSAYLLIIFMMFFAFLYSSSRGGFLALAVGFLALSFEFKNLKKSITISLIIIAIFGAFAHRFMPDKFKDRIMGISDVDSDSTGSSSARLRNMEIGLRYSLKHPFSTLGLGNNYLICITEYPSDHIASVWKQKIEDFGRMDLLRKLEKTNYRYGGHIHNLYLEVLSEVGMIAGFFYFRFIFLLFKYLKKIRNNIVADNENNRQLLFLTKSLKIALISFLVAAFFLPVAYRLYLFLIAGLCRSLCANVTFCDKKVTA